MAKSLPTAQKGMIPLRLCSSLWTRKLLLEIHPTAGSCFICHPPAQAWLSEGINGQYHPYQKAKSSFHVKTQRTGKGLSFLSCHEVQYPFCSPENSACANSTASFCIHKVPMGLRQVNKGLCQGWRGLNYLYNHSRAASMTCQGLHIAAWESPELGKSIFCRAGTFI